MRARDAFRDANGPLRRLLAALPAHRAGIEFMASFMNTPRKRTAPAGQIDHRANEEGRPGGDSGAPHYRAQVVRVDWLGRRWCRDDLHGSARHQRCYSRWGRAHARTNPCCMDFTSSSYHPMNYRAFANDSPSTMYEVVQGALDADDTLKALGEAIRFRVRETSDWKNMLPDVIDVPPAPPAGEHSDRGSSVSQ